MALRVENGQVISPANGAETTGTHKSRDRQNADRRPNVAFQVAHGGSLTPTMPRCWGQPGFECVWPIPLPLGMEMPSGMEHSLSYPHTWLSGMPGTVAHGDGWHSGRLRAAPWSDSASWQPSWSGSSFQLWLSVSPPPWHFSLSAPYLPQGMPDRVGGVSMENGPGPSWVGCAQPGGWDEQDGQEGQCSKDNTGLGPGAQLRSVICMCLQWAPVLDVWGADHGSGPIPCMRL